MSSLKWIIRADNGMPRILRRRYAPHNKSTIGPYFSYKEAIEVLYKWAGKYLLQVF